MGLENFASATTAGYTTIATLTDTNASLAREIIDLTKKLSEKNKFYSDSNATNKFMRKRTGNKYCRSCGFNVRHTSAACQWKKEGHKDEATAENAMGSPPRPEKGAAQ